MATNPHNLEIVDLRKLTIQQQNAIDILVTGCSDKDTADKVGVNRSTITRWRLYHPAFQAELNAQRAAVWGTAKEKLRSLIPEAVDILAQALHDPDNEDRAKLALDLIKAVGASNELDRVGSIDPEAIIKADATVSPFSMLSEPQDYEIRRRESQLQAHLNGLTYGEFDATIEAMRESVEAEERARRKAARDAKKASQATEASSTDTAPELTPAEDEDQGGDPLPAPEAPAPDELPEPDRYASVCHCQQPITIEDEPPTIHKARESTPAEDVPLIEVD